MKTALFGAVLFLGGFMFELANRMQNFHASVFYNLNEEKTTI